MSTVRILGLPDDIKEETKAVCRSRLISAVQKLMQDTGLNTVSLRVDSGEKLSADATDQQINHDDDLSLEQKAKKYSGIEPLWALDQLVAPLSLLEELQTAIESIRLESLVFDTWGLRKIEPFNRSALNFHGSPGTGKTLAAHGLAASLNKKIIVASYAQIESKYHGDGPKNVEAIFYAAQRDDAVLFIDESDSLLSKRLTNVTQGSEQAINSMRSQLLICLEKYKGVVIFATNLVENYDQAFETRVRHIYFPMPDLSALIAIWKKHLPGNLPLSSDVDIVELAESSEGFCGRDIKNAVLDAAFQVARASRAAVGQFDFLAAITRIIDARKDLRKKNSSETGHLSQEETDALKQKLVEKFNAAKKESVLENGAGA